MVINEHLFSKKQSKKDILIKPIFLTFENQKIQTSLKELLKADGWLDLEDFQKKVTAKIITSEDLTKSKIMIDQKKLKELGIFSSSSIYCCICTGEPKYCQIYLFSSCSHQICEDCVDKYLVKKGIETKKIIKTKNLLEYEVISLNRAFPCPNCEGDTISEGFIKLIKIYL